MKALTFITAWTVSGAALFTVHAAETAPWLDLPTIEDRSVWDAFPREAKDVWVELARSESARALAPFSDELFLEYSQTGNRRAYDARHGAAIRQFSTMVLGELAQNQGEFLPAIVTAADGLLAERTWVLSAHDRSLDAFYGRAPVVDLASSHRGMVLAFASVVLEPVLPADLVERMREAVKTRVTEIYRTTVLSGEVLPGLWWMKTTNNWNSVCHNGVVAAALAIEEDPDRRSEILDGMNQYLPYFLDGFTDDGYCTEGLGYWNYGFGNFAQLVEFVRRATAGEQDWLDSEKAVAASLYPFRIELADQTYPTFADGTVGTRPNPVLLDYLAERIEAVNAVHPSRSGIGSYGLIEVLSFGLAGNPPPITTRVQATDRGRDGFTDAGLIILRPGDTDARMSIALKTGHNAEHHNHNDVGSMVIAVDTTQLIPDPGGEVYTARTFSKDRYVSGMLNSYGHSVPRIGDTLQSTGKMFHGEILSTEFGPQYDRVVMDLAPAYEVDGLTELTREVIYSRSQGGSVRVTDSVELETPQTFESALMTYGQWEVLGPDHGILYQGDAALELSWASTPATVKVSTVVIEENTPHGSQPLRIAFTTTEPVTRADITFEMKPTTSPVSYTVDMSGHSPDLDRAIRIQAEAYQTETGGEVMIVNKVNSEGVAFKNWDNEGHSLTWNFPVATDGWYALRVRYSHAVPGLSMRSISWDGEGESGSGAFPSTGGWSSYDDDWAEVYTGVDGEPYLIELSDGVHELTMTNTNSRSMNLDWVELVPVSPTED